MIKLNVRVLNKIEYCNLFCLEFFLRISDGAKQVPQEGLVLGCGGELADAPKGAGFGMW
jgi:hypothetical protein